MAPVPFSGAGMACHIKMTSLTTTEQIDFMLVEWMEIFQQPGHSSSIRMGLRKAIHYFSVLESS